MLSLLISYGVAIPDLGPQLLAFYAARQAKKKVNRNNKISLCGLSEVMCPVICQNLTFKRLAQLPVHNQDHSSGSRWKDKTATSSAASKVAAPSGPKNIVFPIGLDFFTDALSISNYQHYPSIQNNYYTVLCINYIFIFKNPQCFSVLFIIAKETDSTLEVMTPSYR